MHSADLIDKSVIYRRFWAVWALYDLSGHKAHRAGTARADLKVGTTYVVLAFRPAKTERRARRDVWALKINGKLSGNADSGRHHCGCGAGRTGRRYRRVVDTYELPIEFGEQVIVVEPASARSRAREAGALDFFDIETRSEKGVR